MNELLKRLEEMKAEIAELEKTIEEKESEKESGDWKPEAGDLYYLIDNDKNILYYNFNYGPCDVFALEKRNVYETREEAQFALDMYEFCRERSFVPDWEKDDEDKCIIGLHYLSKEKMVVDFSGNYFAPFYYPTYEKAQEVIDKYSFEELAKYYGRVCS